MSVVKTKKYEVSDPAHYDPLITKQKKRARQHFENTEEWLELGRLREAKIDMIKSFAKRQFFIRYCLLIFVAYILLAIISYYLFVPAFWSNSWQLGPISFFHLVGAIALSYMWFLRYPPSGSKYFRKAIVLDPKCGEAYKYLGLIALRRRQKPKACRYLELAIRLNASNKNSLERELKSIYQKEFMSFFKKKSEKEIKQQEIIENQMDRIRFLCSKNASLEKRVESLNGKVEQVKWETNNTEKSLNKEMDNRILAIREDYEERIAAIKLEKESQEEAKELAERDFARLTTEIMEAKAELEGQSLAEAAREVEEIMGTSLWQALSEKTRTFLATAEQVSSMLTVKEDTPDFSLVGMELCKALETEINRTLVAPFLESLNGKRDEFLKINQTGESKGKPRYFTYLAQVVDQKYFPEVNSLTLGQYHFVLKRSLEGEYALREYGYFIDELCEGSKTIIGRTFLRDLETVTKKYRNTIVHQSSINNRECDCLRELIFAGDEALLMTCCRIVLKGH